MFQSIKRASFIGKNNFSHWDAGDLVRMHLWLQENGWPANQFVDLFMRAYPKFDRVMDGMAFELYMCNQYDWVRKDDVNALAEFYDKVNKARFKDVDHAGLVRWLEPMVSGAQKR